MRLWQVAAQKPPSLWRQLWGWTLVALGLTWVVLIAVAYYTGRHEADELGDGQMAAAATLWLRLPQWPSDAAPRPTLGAENWQPLTRYQGYEQAMAIMAWSQGHLRMDSHGLMALPSDAVAVDWAALPQGWHTRVVVLDGQSHRWRILVRSNQPSPSGDRVASRRVVLVADLGARTALGRDFAEHMARPALIVLPLVAMLLGWALQRGLKPLRRLSAQIDALDIGTRSRLQDAPAHIEFTSTVRALHALIDRLEQQLAQERQFASDIAHELRTPLTALSLQAHALQHATSDGERAQAAHTVHHLALQAGHILQQLLDFARAQRQPDGPALGVDVPALVQQVVADHAQAAHDSGHELEWVLTLQPPHPPAPAVQPLLLALALRNLVSNALTHTPAGTQVRVHLQADALGWQVTVDDDGQARTAPQPRPSSAGLGLGLILARRIAQWHDAQWLSGAAPLPYTTRFGLSWPAPAP
jgi:two-component system, OmpR family, sensor histidine kinase QseC